jgi:hypothetical protein
MVLCVRFKPTLASSLARQHVPATRGLKAQAEAREGSVMARGRALPWRWLTAARPLPTFQQRRRVGWQARG